MMDAKQQLAAATTDHDRTLDERKCAALDRRIAAQNEAPARRLPRQQRWLPRNAN